MFLINGLAQLMAIHRAMFIKDGDRSGNRLHWISHHVMTTFGRDLTGTDILSAASEAIQ